LKKLISAILFLVLCNLLIAQTDFSFEDYGKIGDSSRSHIGIWFETNFNSNVLNNSVYYNSVFQTGVTRKSMSNMESRVGNKNIAGTQETERLYYSWLSGSSNDSSKLIHTVNVSTRRSVNTRFGKDAFLLAGFGNKRFAGEQARVDNLMLNLMQFTQIQYGFMNQKKGEISYGAGLAFIMGNRYGQYFLNNSHLYTSEIGDSVFAYANGYLLQSDTSATDIYDISGYGASVDAFVSIPVDLIKNHDGQGSIKIELNELGFISWNSRSVRYNIDGYVDWAGIKAPSIFDVGDSIYKEQVPSNVQDEFVSSSERKSFTSALSPRIAIYYTEKLNDNIELRNMLDYRFNANYLPYIGCTQIFRLTKTAKDYKWFLNVHESLGGYGYLGLGMGIQVEHNKFGAVLGTRNLMAMAVPEILSGFNVYLGFKWNFK